VHPNSGRRFFFTTAIGSLWLFLSVYGAAASSDDPPSRSEKNSAETDVYEPGKDVKAPKLVHYVEPKFSAQSKEAFVEGTVKISTVITTDGQASEYKVVSGLNAEQDRTAIEVLRQWRFQPGTKNGKPVKVRVMVEVEFHLL
jgi:TonB family protein